MIDPDPHSLDIVYELAINRRFIDPAVFLALIAELRASRKVVELARQEVVFDEPLYHALADYDRLRKQ